MLPKRSSCSIRFSIYFVCIMYHALSRHLTRHLYHHRSNLRLHLLPRQLLDRCLSQLHVVSKRLPYHHSIRRLHTVSELLRLILMFLQKARICMIYLCIVFKVLMYLNCLCDSESCLLLLITLIKHVL